MTKNIVSFAEEDQNVDDSASDVSLILKLSHELKTPIHGISGISAYLNNNWNELNDDTRRKGLEAITVASESLVTLVDSLLNKRHNQEKIDFDFQKVDLVKIAKEIVVTCQNLYINKKNIEIKLETDIAECVSMADAFWYGQVLTNLISNSVNYSQKGTISVKLSTDKINGIDYCSVLVQDEGVGIPEGELDTIFIPFNRGSRDNLYFKGSGLGLAICQEVVEAHGGTISASNNKKIGVTVDFHLPIKI
ncbi:MAG: HAMP domain-containing sensor histidine kinase [Rickettsiaceae bacterium]|nr:HAMP domain-containing sensor histidine kinase [Rickettsiaceae bacterium]